MLTRTVTIVVDSKANVYIKDTNVEERAQFKWHQCFKRFHHKNKEQTHEWTASEKWEWREKAVKCKTASNVFNALQVDEHNRQNSVGTAWNTQEISRETLHTCRCNKMTIW